MTSSPRKMMVLGLAGIGWDDLAARIAAGTLPAIATLAAGGAAGRLASPLSLPGPAPWATIATGLAPDRHRILLMDEPWAGGLRGTGRASWCADPVWLRLADAGFATAGVGWPATAPGADWPGVHVDPRFFVPNGKTFDEWLPALRAAPDAWIDKLRDLRVHPHDVQGSMLLPFVPALATVDQTRDTRLIELALAIASLGSRHAAAMALIETASWDALFVHHGWIAQITARFGDAEPPFDRVVDAAWTLLDQMVGAMAAVLPDTAFLIASPGRPGQAGMIMATGPHVPPGVLRGISTLDLAPTILARFGLADPDLPGRAFLPADDTLRPAPPMRPPPAPVEPGSADLERVAAFGHCPPPPPAGWHSRMLTVQAEMLLGFDPAAAARMADAALALDPCSISALGARAAAHVAAQEAEPLPDLAERIAAAAPGHLWEPLVRAGYHALRGEASLAQPFLGRVEAEGGPEERLRAAAAWMMLRRPADAARLLGRLVAEQPDNVPALLASALACTRPLDAEPRLRRVLELDPGHRQARETLVALLRDTGRTTEAEALRR